MASSSQTSATLPTLYANTLTDLAPVFDDTLSLSSEQAQSILKDAHEKLNLIAKMLTSLGVFSTNEELEELGDGEMVFASLDWVRAEVEGRLRTEGIRARAARLQESQISYLSFLTLLHTYGFPFPEQLASLNAHRDGVDLDRLRHQLAPREPAQRREAKIAQYKAEKQVRTNLEAALGGGEAVSLAGSPLPAIAALLRATSSSSESSQGGSSSGTSVNPGIHDNVRQTTILLLQYLCVFTAAALSTIAQELELLQGVLGQAHIEEELEEHREKQHEEERLRQEGKGKQERDGDSTWRLDAPMRMLGRGPKAHLIDERGKPTQPFTILPSQGLQNMSDRARMQAEVFRSSHRLPTMTIDEYLEEEQRRGNIITGGGPQQDAQLTESELLALAAEEDGTTEGERKEEEKRQKEERWARYTDTHRKGEGNSMNRG